MFGPKAVMVQEMLIDLYETVESWLLIPVGAPAAGTAAAERAGPRGAKAGGGRGDKNLLPAPALQDEEAVEFLWQLFEAEPGQKTIEPIRKLKNVAAKRGWQVGNQASFYRINPVREVVA